MPKLGAGWYWETDARHRVRQVFGRRLAHRGAGLLGRRPWEIGGVQAGVGADAAAAAMQARRAFRDLRWSIADTRGRVHHFIVSGQPCWGPRGGFLGYRGVGRDVTAVIEAERALDLSESQLAAIIDSAMDAILTVDSRERVMVFNEAAGRLFNCTRVHALGLPLADLIPGGIGAVLAAGGMPRPREWKQVRAGQVDARRFDGLAVTVEASVSRIALQGREMYTLVLRDLTDRLAWERARHTLETQLRESQKMEALGTLAGGIAHDFNNIVAAILGNAGLLRARLPAELEARVFVEEIAKAGLRARDLVQRIMAFSRRQPSDLVCQPLQPVISEAVQLLRATLPSGITIEASLDAEPLHVKADATQMSQVLMNLGTNAWQALGSQPGHIHVALTRAGPHEVRLRVADDGCGMDEATLARIFEPFFTTKPKGEGTGLGLPVVHGVISGHGGRIGVSSRKGEGTTFDIYLPLAQAAQQPLAPVPQPAAPPRAGRGEHIVYLDDYPAIVFMMKATLEALGYRVTAFEEVGAALAFLRENAEAVDLLVTDYNMPGRCGLDVARDVLRLRPDLPVVVASGYITDDLRDNAVAAGVARLFDKPRGIDGLCELVGELLRDHAGELA